MHEHDARTERQADPLAEIIRAAGRRAAPPPEHRDQVFEAAHAAWQGKLRSRRRMRWLAIAASVGSLLVAGALVQLMIPAESGPVATVVVAHGRVELRLDGTESWTGIGDARSLTSDMHIRTVGDGGAALDLAAGGSLRLDADTEIDIGATRFELVTGRIYFDSHGRLPGALFEIETSLGVVRDIGTQFEVATVQDRLRIRVRSGRVTFAGTSSYPGLTGEAGNEIELSADGVSVKAFAPDDPAWRWAESLATPPSSTSILSFLTWVARETGKRLEFEPDYVEQFAESRDSNIDPEGYTPMEVLDLIEVLSDFRYETTDDGIIVTYQSP